MLAALTLELWSRLARSSWGALISFLRQPPRERLFAVIVILVLLVDFGIPLLTLGCMSWGHCPFLHP